MIQGAFKRTVASAGARLSVLEAGDPARPTIVFIHGYPDTKELWLAVLERLRDRFHVVAYDVRGAGQSSAPRLPAAYDYDRLAEDFEAVIDQVAPGREVHLVGHDWGGLAGWEFATHPRFESRLASFTSIAGPSLDQRGHVVADEAAPGTILQGTQGGTPFLVRQRAARARRSHLGVAGVARAAVAGSGSCATSSVSPPARSTRRRRSPRTRCTAPTCTGGNIPRRLLRPHTDRVAHVPVQLIVPSGDRYIHPSYYELAERSAPRLRRRVVAGSHFAPLSRPELIAGWVSELVDEVQAGADPQPRRAWERGGGFEQFPGRLALVTGAGSGIGRCTAHALAGHGVRLLLVDRDGESVSRVASSLPDAEPFTCDVSDAAAMERLAEDVIARHGVPDIVINNAGIAVAGPFLETGFDDWRRVLDINLMGVVHGARLFGRAMVQRGEGGHIVNTASAAAFQPTKELPAYAASKAAVLMLSQCLRAELLPSGIGVTAVCPGIVATNITRTARYVGHTDADQQRLGDYVSRIYERRNFTPDQVAAEIVEAIAVDRPVAVVTPEAKVMHALSRIAPGLLRRFAGLDALPI